MYNLAIMCFLLLSCSLSQSQTVPVSADTATNETGTQQSTDCCITVALSGQQNEGKQRVGNSELPDAPSTTSLAQTDEVIWNLSEPATQPKPTLHPDPIWDTTMWTAHIFLAGTIIFDVEETHQGLAHHNCIEGNSDLQSHPSRGELYRDNLLQFAPEVGMDWLVAAGGRSGHLPRWAWKTLGYMGPVYGGTVHLRGGIRWVTRCM
jgi:hypothetical protein